MNSWRKLLAFVSLILSGVTGSQAATSGGTSPGLLGTDLTRARSRSDYFQFFNLELTGPAQPLANGGQILSFKPSGSDFHQLVTVYVETDSTGLISALRVIIARSFIDDPQNGVFARDLIKSSLLTGVSEGDAGNLNELATEILYRNLKRTLLSRSEPTLSATPSAAYLVVEGTNSEWETTLTSSTIKLTNQTQENRPALVIEIRVK